MKKTELNSVVTDLASLFGFDPNQVNKVVILPHQVEVTSIYVNGAGKVVENTTFHPITITLPEEK